MVNFLRRKLSFNKKKKDFRSVVIDGKKWKTTTIIIIFKTPGGVCKDTKKDAFNMKRLVDPQFSVTDIWCRYTNVHVY